MFKKKNVKKTSLRDELIEDLNEGVPAKEANSEEKNETSDNENNSLSKSSKSIKKGKFFGFQVQKIGNYGISDMMNGSIHDSSGLTDKEFLRQTGAERKDKQLENFVDQKLKEFHKNINKTEEEPAPPSIQKENPLFHLRQTLEDHQKQSVEELKRLAEVGPENATYKIYFHENAKEKSILMTGLRELDTPMEEKLRILEHSEWNKRCILLQQDLKKEEIKREEKVIQKEMEIKKKAKKKMKEEIVLRKKFKRQGRLYRMEMLQRKLNASMIENVALNGFGNKAVQKKSYH